MIEYLYYKFIYQHLMKLSHNYGFHQMRTAYPDGDTMLRCDWCGLSVVTQKATNPCSKYPDTSIEDYPQQVIEND